MVDLLPSTPDLSRVKEAEPKVIGVDSDDADAMLSALSSDTSRDLLAALHDEPDTASGLADRVDTTLQNTTYHLENLAEADLVTVADTVYSQKGREMKVYAPTNRPLVVYAGREDETWGLKQALARLVGGVALLGLVSLLVQFLADGNPFAGTTNGGSTFSGQDVQMSTSEQIGAADQAAQAVGLPPGLLFFLGGALVLLLAFGGWYWRVQR